MVERDHHAEWSKCTSEQIAAAKEIYKKSKNFDPTIDLDKVGGEIWDMLDEGDYIKLKPIRKKIFTIDLFNTPIDFRIAISLVLFLTKIVKPEIILKAATIIINDKIINITFRSTFKAENNELFISAQL